MIENKISIPKYSRYERELKQKITKSFNKRIVLISDSHISNAANSLFNRVIFRKALTEIKKIPNVDYIIHLGDLTDNGTYLEYEIAQDLLRNLDSEKLYIIPGNHDSKNVGYLLFEEIFGKRTFEIDDNDIYILGIDSSMPDQDAGHIGMDTIRLCENDFGKHQDQIKLFCFHHQTIPIPYTGRERSAIFDGGDVLNMTLKSDVDLIINGHRHITHAYSCTRGRKDLVIFNCGTLSCNKTRYKEQYTYTILDISEDSLKFVTKRLMADDFLIRERRYNNLFSTNNIDNSKLCARIIHMGNTHYSKNHYDIGLNDNAIKLINSLEPDVIVHTGSLTFSNKEEEYDIAIRELKKFKYPIFLLPGSRDLRKYGWDLFKTEINDQKMIMESENFRILKLNAITRHITTGNVGRRKLKETTEFFQTQDDNKINIVAFNHRLIPPPKLKFDEILTDSGSVINGLTNPANKVHLVLMGKNNIGFTLQLEDTILSYCGTISSFDTVELIKHSFNLIEIYDSGFVQIREFSVETGVSKIIGSYWIKR
ncbi:MAG: hypothetical protein GF364_07280 [Candidatus Lokiarchaeota archaeon]|nr:hypothetical protein [Candidatus Lokiarchaeota archaeon]